MHKVSKLSSRSGRSQSHLHFKIHHAYNSSALHTASASDYIRTLLTRSRARHIPTTTMVLEATMIVYTSPTSPLRASANSPPQRRQLRILPQRRLRPLALGRANRRRQPHLLRQDQRVSQAKDRSYLFMGERAGLLSLSSLYSPQCMPGPSSYSKGVYRQQYIAFEMGCPAISFAEFRSSGTRQENFRNSVGLGTNSLDIL